ncbi:hypothetical protein ACETRX_36635 [Labrys portucalensis]|uniref:Uncharacterized protein n=1 Tax=Labrys neptuniae TaxID=376174 RepID=A0ABV6ZSF1_9HYPH
MSRGAGIRQAGTSRKAGNDHKTNWNTQHFTPLSMAAHLSLNFLRTKRNRKHPQLNQSLQNENKVTLYIVTIKIEINARIKPRLMVFPQQIYKYL